MTRPGTARGGMPDWMWRQIADDLSRPEVDGYTVRARGGWCRECRAGVLRGLDDDQCGQPAQIEPAVLSRRGEAFALCAGRKTYRLTGHVQATLRLWYRDRWDIRDDVIGTSDSLGVVVVVAGHRCNSPVPMEWRSDQGRIKT